MEIKPVIFLASGFAVEMTKRHRWCRHASFDWFRVFLMVPHIPELLKILYAFTIDDGLYGG